MALPFSSGETRIDYLIFRLGTYPQDSGTRPTVGDTAGLGEPPGGKILSTLFEDPDGIIVQLDQRLS